LKMELAKSVPYIKKHRVLNSNSVVLTLVNQTRSYSKLVNAKIVTLIKRSKIRLKVQVMEGHVALTNVNQTRNCSLMVLANNALTFKRGKVQNKKSVDLILVKIERNSYQMERASHVTLSREVRITKKIVVKIPAGQGRRFLIQESAKIVIHLREVRKILLKLLKESKGQQTLEFVLATNVRTERKSMKMALVSNAKIMREQ
jgi:hypothetical protein